MTAGSPGFPCGGGKLWNGSVAMAAQACEYSKKHSLYTLKRAIVCCVNHIKIKLLKMYFRGGLEIYKCKISLKNKRKYRRLAQ